MKKIQLGRIIYEIFITVIVFSFYFHLRGIQNNLDKLIVEPFLMLHLQRNFNWMLRFFPQKKSLIWVWNSLLVWRPHIPLYLWNFWIGFERFRRFGDVGLSRLSMAIENLIGKCSPEKNMCFLFLQYGWVMHQKVRWKNFGLCTIKDLCKKYLLFVLSCIYSF